MISWLLIVASILTFRFGRPWHGAVFSIVAMRRNRTHDEVVEALEVFIADGDFADAAFPDAEDSPAEGGQLFFVADAAGNVALDLRLPELYFGFRQTEVLAAFVAVPEASVDEYDGLVLGEDDVGIARELAHLNAEAQTAGEKILPHDHLGLGVLPPNSRHAAAPLLQCHRVRHTQTLLKYIME